MGASPREIRRRRAAAQGRAPAQACGCSLELDAFLEDAAIEVAAVTHAQAKTARLAHRRFGKGRHPAGLNLGECFAYTLAKASGEPLLCKGDDFPRTDLVLA